MAMFSDLPSPTPTPRAGAAPSSCASATAGEPRNPSPAARRRASFSRFRWSATTSCAGRFLSFRRTRFSAEAEWAEMARERAEAVARDRNSMVQNSGLFSSKKYSVL